MSDLIVLAFDNEDGAIQMRDKLGALQKQQIIQLEDAAVVIRRQDGKVKVKQAVSLVGAGALGGAFWGMLIGLIFWMPWLGLAMGALGDVSGARESWQHAMALFMMIDDPRAVQVRQWLSALEARLGQS